MTLTAQSFKSTGDVNKRLVELGLPKISTQHLQKTVGTHTKPRLVKALITADTDGGAKRFLQNICEEAVNDNQPASVPEPQNNAPRQASTTSPQNNASRNTSSSGPSNESSRGTMSEADRMSVHIYGGKGAICFSTALTRDGDATVMLDAADSSGERSYAWENKICIQLTPAELPFVLGVFLGFIKKCDYKGHGAQNTKSFGVEHQGTKLFMNVSEKDKKMKAVPVTLGDGYLVVTLLLRQMRKATPWLSVSEIINLVRLTVTPK